MWGDREHRSCFPERLGDAPAVGSEHGNAVDHCLDCHEWLILGDKRWQKANLREPPESTGVIRVLVKEHVAVGAEIEAAGGDVRLGPLSFNDQKGDVRPSPAKNVGDPGEDTDSFLDRGVHEHNTRRLPLESTNTLAIDEIGQDRAP